MLLITQIKLQITVIFVIKLSSVVRQAHHPELSRGKARPNLMFRNFKNNTNFYQRLSAENNADDRRLSDADDRR